MPRSPSTALRPHDRVRPAAVGSSSFAQPANLHDRLGHYHRADVRNGGIRYSRADRPEPPFTIQVMVTPGSSSDAEPDPYVDCLSIERVHLAWTRSVGGALADPVPHNVLLSTSDDDGETWQDPVTIFSGAKHPVLSGTDSGSILILARRTSDGAILGIEEVTPGSYTAPWVVLDHTNEPVLIDDDTFDVYRAPVAEERYVIVAVQGGNVVELDSDDDLRTADLVS